MTHADHSGDGHVGAGHGGHGHTGHDGRSPGSGLGAQHHTPLAPHHRAFEASLGRATEQPPLGANDEIGNPAEYQHDWFFQQHDGYCVPASITQVIEAQSGITLHNYGLVEQELAHLGLPSTGITLQDASRVLQSFDIPNHMISGGSAQSALDQLTKYLSEGRNVIVAVNASPIWYGSATADNPTASADHGLVVTAINAVTGQVTLSDPGTQQGNEETVSLQTFMDAWSASTVDTPPFSMLVTDSADGGHAETAAAAAVGIAEGVPTTSLPPSDFTATSHDFLTSAVDDLVHHPGSVLLPIVLAAAGLAGAKATRSATGKAKPSTTIPPVQPA